MNLRPQLAFRIVSGSALLFALLRPGWFVRPRLGPLAVVWDGSASMSEPEGGISRWEAARTRWQLMESKAPAFVLGSTLAWDSAASAPTAAWSAFANLIEVPRLAGNLEALVFFSDGRAQDQEAAAAAAERLGIPLFAVGFHGGPQPPDLWIEEVRSPQVAFAGAASDIAVRIGRRNAPGSARVALWRGNRQIATAILPASSGTWSETSLPYRPLAAGTDELRLEVEALAGERRRANNRRDLAVEVSRNRLRALYIAGRPSAHYNFLRAQLKSDPSVDLVSFVILRDPEDLPGASENELALIPFPKPDTLAGELRTFDVIILENFPFSIFGLGSAFTEAVVAQVRRGGGLMLSGENPFWSSQAYQKGALAPLFSPEFVPAPEGRFAFLPQTRGHSVTSLANDPEASARLWRQAAALESPVAGLWPSLAGGQVLAASPDGAPVLSASEAGRGRVLLLTSLTSWRWALGGGAQGPWIYQRFWENVVRWLGASPDFKRLRLVHPAPPVLVGEPTLLAAQWSGSEAPKAIELRLQGPTSGATTLRPAGAGLYEDTYRFDTPGTYRLEAKVRGTVEQLLVNAESPWDEWADTSPDFAFLERLANANGGEAIYVEELTRRRLRRWRRAAAERRESGRQSDWIWLAAVISIFAGEWFYRRRRSLP